MSLFNVLKLGLLIAAGLFVLIPGWMNYFDKGHDQLTIEELLNGKKPESRNLTIEGIALFDYLYKYVEKKKDGSEYEVSYFIPLVDSSWTKEKEVKCFVHYRSGSFNFKPDYKTALAKIEAEIDSMKKLPEKRIRLETFCQEFDSKKLEEEVVPYFKYESDLKLAKEEDLKRLVVNETKAGLKNLLLLTGFLIVAITALTWWLSKK